MCCVVQVDRRPRGDDLRIRSGRGSAVAQLIAVSGLTHPSDEDPPSAQLSRIEAVHVATSCTITRKKAPPRKRRLLGQPTVSIASAIASTVFLNDAGSCSEAFRWSAQSGCADFHLTILPASIPRLRAR